MSVKHECCLFVCFVVNDCVCRGVVTAFCLRVFKSRHSNPFIPPSYTFLVMSTDHRDGLT